VAWVRADQAALADPGRRHSVAADQLADQVVRQVAAIFFRHAAFLRPVMLVSAAHPEIRRRGSYYGRELGDLVTAALMHARDDIDHPDPETAVRGAFNTVFATLVMRVAYGPAFVTPADDDEAFLGNLSTVTRRYLFRLERWPRPVDAVHDFHRTGQLADGHGGVITHAHQCRLEQAWLHRVIEDGPNPASRGRDDRHGTAGSRRC
jgi:hypothetical protein